MTFYKVLTKHKGKLSSLLFESPMAIEYKEVTHAPKGTGLFIFDSLEEAKLYKGEFTVIYEVEVESPRRVDTIIDFNHLLDCMDREGVMEFWRGNHERSIVVESNFYICDSLRLIKEIIC